MGKRQIEILLLLPAAALLAWALHRAGGRGELAVKAWTSYAMAGLVIVCAINVFARLKIVAVACAVVCVLFTALVVLAAVLGAEDKNPDWLPAILRALSFFLLIGVASLMQAIPARAVKPILV